jgi:hypothetical protein
MLEQAVVPVVVAVVVNLPRAVLVMLGGIPLLKGTLAVTAVVMLLTTRVAVVGVTLILPVKTVAIPQVVVQLAEL